MKILFTIRSLTGGGAERVVSVLSGLLADVGEDVHIITYKTSERDYSISEKVQMGCSLFLIHCITDPQLLSFRYNPFIIISVACVGMIKSKKEFFERNRNEKEYE